MMKSRNKLFNLSGTQLASVLAPVDSCCSGDGSWPQFPELRSWDESESFEELREWISHQGFDSSVRNLNTMPKNFAKLWKEGHSKDTSPYQPIALENNNAFCIAIDESSSVAKVLLVFK